MKNFWIVTLIILFLGFFHTRGWIPYDEGWFVAAANRSLSGESIYRDYLFLYNPGGVWMNQIGMAVFGRSVLSTRIVAGINSLAAIGIIYLISRQMNFSRMAKFLAMGIYLFWGPGIINFGWPVMWCLTTALANGLLLSRYKFFGVGITASLIFVFKQNFGMAILIADLLYWLMDTEIRNLKNAKLFIRGYLTVIIPMLAYLSHIGSLNEYLRQIWYFSVERILIAGALKSPWPWEFPLPMYMLLPKLAVYGLPISIAVWGVIKFPIKQKMWPLILGSFWLLSIRPTTDLIHLAPLLAFTGLVAAMTNKRTFHILLICLLIGGIFQSIQGRYYKWNTPLINQNIYIDSPRIKLFTDQTAVNSINRLTDYFNQNKTGEKYMFIYSFSPMWYLVLDKQNPTRYDYLHSGVVTTKDEKEVISDLVSKNVTTILTDHDIAYTNSLISEFIRERFSPEYRINDYTVWKKSPGPFLARQPKI